MHSDAELIGLIDAIREGLQSLPPTAVYDRKAGPNFPLAIFPVSNLYVGLLTDEQELGEKWDSKIARAHLLQTFGWLVAINLVTFVIYDMATGFLVQSWVL